MRAFKLGTYGKACRKGGQRSYSTWVIYISGWNLAQGVDKGNMGLIPLWINIKGCA